MSAMSSSGRIAVWIFAVTLLIVVTAIVIVVTELTGDSPSGTTQPPSVYEKWQAAKAECAAADRELADLEYEHRHGRLKPSDYERLRDAAFFRGLDVCAKASVLERRWREGTPVTRLAVTTTSPPQRKTTTTAVPSVHTDGIRQTFIRTPTPPEVCSWRDGYDIPFGEIREAQWEIGAGPSADGQWNERSEEHHREYCVQVWEGTDLPYPPVRIIGTAGGYELRRTGEVEGAVFYQYRIAADPKRLSEAPSYHLPEKVRRGTNPGRFFIQVRSCSAAACSDRWSPPRPVEAR